MGTSLRKGLAALSTSMEAAFVVLADQPFVHSSTLNQMIAYHAKHTPQILIPLYRGFRGNPVLLDRLVFPDLMNLTGDIGCRAIFGSHAESIQRLAVDDPGILLDIDSAEDWERLSASGDPVAHFKDMAEFEGQKATGVRPELVVVGRDAMARALANLARMMEYTVTIVDPILSLEELPEADRVLHVLDFTRLVGASMQGTAERYVVVASRGQFDEEAVEQAVRIEAKYTALLANRQRAEEIFRSLTLRGLPPEKVAAVRAPAGLDIGAESPAEIALSIMAEIVASRRRLTESKG